LLITLLIAAVGFVSWLLLRQPSEPVYQGKPLSHWCEQFVNTLSKPDNQSQEQAGIAIRTIGTNAIPTLLLMLQAEDSKIKLKLIQLAQKQHFFHIKWTDTEFRHQEAEMGFLILSSDGKSAIPAIPALLEIYNERHSDPNDAIRYTAENILGSMGPVAADAVPRFVQATTHTNVYIRWSAILTLRAIHANPNLTVPVLTRSLRDPVDYVRRDAASALAAFGHDAKSAVPDLIKCLADPSPAVREQAAAALKTIDPEAAAKAGVK
jgi:hypothetical protein